MHRKGTLINGGYVDLDTRPITKGDVMSQAGHYNGPVKKAPLDETVDMVRALEDMARASLPARLYEALYGSSGPSYVREEDGSLRVRLTFDSRPALQAMTALNAAIRRHFRYVMIDGVEIFLGIGEEWEPYSDDTIREMWNTYRNLMRTVGYEPEVRPLEVSKGVRWVERIAREVGRDTRPIMDLLGMPEVTFTLAPDALVTEKPGKSFTLESWVNMKRMFQTFRPLRVQRERLLHYSPCTHQYVAPPDVTQYVTSVRDK